MSPLLAGPFRQVPGRRTGGTGVLHTRLQLCRSMARLSRLQTRHPRSSVDVHTSKRLPSFPACKLRQRCDGGHQARRIPFCKRHIEKICQQRLGCSAEHRRRGFENLPQHRKHAFLHRCGVTLARRQSCRQSRGVVDTTPLHAPGRRA